VYSILAQVIESIYYRGLVVLRPERETRCCFSTSDSFTDQPAELLAEIYFSAPSCEGMEQPIAGAAVTAAAVDNPRNDGVRK
jgi:hypothetical protein